LNYSPIKTISNLAENGGKRKSRWACPTFGAGPVVPNSRQRQWSCP